MCRFKGSFWLFLAIFVLVSCSGTPRKTAEEKLQDTKYKEKVFHGTPEPVSGKLDVYATISRTVKYNADHMVESLNRKLFVYDENSTPKSIIESSLVSKNPDENPLFGSMRALNFSIMFATSALTENNLYLNHNLYEKASQNLALGAIKSHKDTLHALKALREIERQVKKEEKQLKELDDKFDRKGALSADEDYYKKGLEVSLLKLSRMKEALSSSVLDYNQLIHNKTEEAPELEGKVFYELEDLDRSLTIESFQKTALVNRSEFKISQEFGGSYSFTDIQADLFKKYPQFERLNINNYTIENPVYAKDLHERTVDISNRLVEKVIAYKNAEAKALTVTDKNLRILSDEVVFKARREAFNQLTIAIFAQVETAYNLMKLADGDRNEIDTEVKALKKIINHLEKNIKSSADSKIELVNAGVKLLELEARKSEILGERAVAIRSMYFTAGFEPFDRELLNENIKEMATKLRARFNNEATEMLAAKVPESLIPVSEPGIDNKWAKQENWLEAVLDHRQTNAKAERMSEETGLFSLYEGDEPDTRQTMQLGAYKIQENADIEWALLSELFPELKTYSPQIEKAEVGGELFYRLKLVSADGGFKDICNRLRASRVECILR